MNKKKLIIVPIIQKEHSTDVYNQTIKKLSQLGNTVIIVDYTKSEKSLLKEFFLKRRIYYLKEKSNGVFISRYYRLIPYLNFKYAFLINVFLYYFILILAISYKNQSYYFSRSIFWVIHPWREDFGLISKLFTFSLFDCTDFIGEKIDDVNKYIKQIRSFSFVFFNSKTLAKLYGKMVENYFVVPQGFRLEKFHTQKEEKQLFPVIGYVGSINDRIDYELLVYLANQFKDYRFELWGKMIVTGTDKIDVENKYKKMASVKNIYLDSCSKNAISRVISRFDIAVIPYTNSAFNKYSYPMKLMEYFFHGKYIISSKIFELEKFEEMGYLSIARSKKQWARYIREATNSKEHHISKEKRHEMKKIAYENSWQIKLSSILQRIDELQN